MKTTSLIFLMVCAFVLASCSIDDNPVAPTPQKRVSKITVSCKYPADEEYAKDLEQYFTYDAQGRLLECKYVDFFKSGKEMVVETTAFSYADGFIHSFNKTYPYDDVVETLIGDTDIELDDQGRIVKTTLYGYNESETREDATVVVDVYTYDEQGYLVRIESSDGAVVVFEWQDGNLFKKAVQYKPDQSPQVSTYEYSDVPTGVLMPLARRNSFEVFEQQGYFGRRSRFLPSKITDELPDSYALNERSYTYEVVDGQVTGWLETYAIRIPSLGISNISIYRKNTVEWE